MGRAQGVESVRNHTPKRGEGAWFVNKKDLVVALLLALAATLVVEYVFHLSGSGFIFDLRIEHHGGNSGGTPATKEKVS